MNVLRKLSPDFRTSVAVLIFLILMLLLPGCALLAPREQVVVREPLSCQIPPQLEPRDIPEYRGRTWRDLAHYATRLLEQLRASEADKAAAKEALKQP